MKYLPFFKRICAALLVFLLAFNLLPLGTLAADTDNFEDLGNNGAIWARVQAALNAAPAALSGSGTQADPYLLEHPDDFITLSEQVKSGNSFSGEYLKLTQDITLANGWEGIGPTSYTGSNGVGLKPFSGIFDGGNHTITIPSGGKGLFNYLREATVQNLKIQGAYINGCALLNNYIVDYGEDGSYNDGTGGSYAAGCPDTAYFENVHIVGATRISGSGFAGGDASGGNTITIRHCSIGSGVTLGCDRNGSSLNRDAIGSFGGGFNGRIVNCSSAATVYGKSHVGGLFGGKAQSMGPAIVENSTFSGTVRASGNFVGGIVGSGYLGGNGYDISTAPNTPSVSIIGSSVTGNVIGADFVGGIFGGEESQVQCWSNGIGTIQDNAFSGNLTSSGSRVGGVIGYMNSLNKYNIISGNTFTSDCGASKGIGGAKYIDTSYANPTAIAGVIYVNTESEMPPYNGFVEWDHQRTDDPLGVHANNLAANGTMTALNASNYKDQYFKGEAFTLSGATITVSWSNGTSTPIDPSSVSFDGYDPNAEGTQHVTLRYKGLSCTIQVTVTAAKVTSFTISEGYQTEYFLGQSLDLSGATITAAWEDGSITHPTQNNLTIQNYDANQEGSQTVTVSYGGKSCTITVTVKKPWVTSLTVSGTYKTVYALSDTLNLDGAVITATWADGSTTHPTVSELTISGFDSDSPGQKTVTLRYGGQETTITVTVSKPSDEMIRVTFTLLGDSNHGDSGGTHTLSGDGLQTWISATTYSIPKDSTVKFLLEKVLKEHSMSWTNPSGNYVSHITRNGIKLGEFTNGNLSGWMYTLNGTHPLLGVAEQKLKNGDKIVWHYTDDYTKEEGSEKWNTPSGDTNDGSGANGAKTADDVIKLIDAIGTPITSASKAQIDAARAAYDQLTAAQKESVSNYNKLLEAERQLDELLGSGSAQDLDTIFRTTGDYLFNTVSTPVVGYIGGEWAILGLARAEYPCPQEYFEKYYANVEQYVMDCGGILHEKKYTDYSRVTLALTAIGKDPRNVAGYDLLAPLADFDKVIWQGINGPIFALIALDSANYPVPEAPVGTKQTTRQNLVAYILENEVEGGGWSLSGNADVDITAMAIQSLAPYYLTNSGVKEAVDRGLEALSQMQSDRGGFSNGYEMNSESCAQVIVALAALGIDPNQDPRFIKNGRTPLDAIQDFAVGGGGFKHVMSGEVNGMATEQAYYAITAYLRMRDGKTTLYDMTDIHNYGGDPMEEAPDETTEPTHTVETNAPSDFPWWAVAVIGICAAAGSVLLIKRKTLFR